MSVRVTVEVPEELAQKARLVATQTSRRFEDVLTEWLGRVGSESAVEHLSDDEVLAACDEQLDADRQEEMSALLIRHREEQLVAGERDRLDELMRVYRAGLVRKARALQVAVARGLRPRLQ